MINIRKPEKDQNIILQYTPVSFIRQNVQLSVGGALSKTYTRNVDSDRISDPRWVSLSNISLRGLHNGRNGVSNHQPQDCLLNRLFRRRSTKTSKLHVTGLCEFPAQMANNTENVSIWRRHHMVYTNQYRYIIHWQALRLVSFTECWGTPNFNSDIVTRY